VLVHLVDVSELGPQDPVQAVHTIRRELRLYSPDLLSKTEVIVASKTDIVSPAKLKCLEEFCRKQGMEPLQISAVTGVGIGQLKDCMASHLGVSRD
jgi:GTP-binding protein